MKKTIMIVLTGLMILSLCACGSRAAGSAGDTQAKSEAEDQAAQTTEQSAEADGNLPEGAPRGNHREGLRHDQAGAG